MDSGVSCFFHLRRLRQIKRHVTPEAMNQLVAAVILGRMDYCYAVLAGLPWSTVAPLQRVQNAAARLVLGLSPRDHVSSALVELHWLPVCYRIQFKLGVLMYMAHNGQSPTYTLTPVSRGPARGRLRSAGTMNPCTMVLRLCRCDNTITQATERWGSVENTQRRHCDGTGGTEK